MFLLFILISLDIISTYIGLKFFNYEGTNQFVNVFFITYIASVFVRANVVYKNLYLLVS